MMCSLKKDALIFQVGTETKDPIIVIEQKHFTKEEPDSSIPLLGIYNGHHYQSVLPASNEDEQLTVDIVKYFSKFQGNFKSFLAHKANIQKMKKATIVEELCEVKPKLENEAKHMRMNSTYEGPAFELENSKFKLKTEGTIISIKEPDSVPENPKIQAKYEGKNTSNEGPILKQENNFENETKHKQV